MELDRAIFITRQYKNIPDFITLKDVFRTIFVNMRENDSDIVRPYQDSNVCVISKSLYKRIRKEYWKLNPDGFVIDHEYNLYATAPYGFRILVLDDNKVLAV